MRESGTRAAEGRGAKKEREREGPIVSIGTAGEIRAAKRRVWPTSGRRIRERELFSSIGFPVRLYQKHPREVNAGERYEIEGCIQDSREGNEANEKNQPCPGAMQGESEARRPTTGIG